MTSPTAARRRGVVLTTLLALVALSVSFGARAATATVEERGYLPARDGTLLRYDVVYPAQGTTHPVLINYEGYGAGSNAFDNGVSVFKDRLLQRGYAVMGLQVRGTGCSQGAFDPFDKTMGQDGYDAVEWAATQAWSDGRVGMIGVSFGGITQLYTAAQRPPHLLAIAASSALSDLYRDVAYPGGVLNAAFPFAWSGLVKADGAQAVALTEMPNGDPACAGNYATHEVANTPNYFLPKVILDRPYADDTIEGDTWADRAPEAGFYNIGVPTFLFNQWQDEQLPARIWDDLGLFGRPDLLWANFSNGNHGRDYHSALDQQLTLDFLDHFVRGVANGFDTNVPHISIGMETRTNFGGDVNVPTWSIASSGIPQPTPRAFYMGTGRSLGDATPGGTQAPDSYVYPLPSADVTETGQNMGNDTTGTFAWKVPVPPGGAVGYTSQPLGSDLVVAGPASLDLWLSSTASDTDVQATITEVRPDGQETYVQRGWLRASHRRLDPARSTVLRPYQTNGRADAEPLVSGQATFMRLEIFPFAHAFRAGSRLRVWIDAPTSHTGFWGFAPVLTPAINSVLHDADHPSRLVVGVLDGEQAQGPVPACDTLRNQPCRTDPLR